MLRILKRALTGRTATTNFPDVIEEPPDGFRGKPVIDVTRCTACDKCAAACPTSALSVETAGETGGVAAPGKIVSLNYGDCIFCGECGEACPDAIHLTKECQLATLEKADLTTRAEFRVNEHGEFAVVRVMEPVSRAGESLDDIGEKLKRKIRQRFGRSLHIREVDAGSCNGCEVEITALNNPVHDIERFGVHFVASPRHADMLLVTGPVTRNMEIALRQTYEATPDPKLVVAAGACAIGGGIFGKSYASCGGVDTVVPVDAYIPGCPPRPEALLHGILVALDRYPRMSPSRTEPRVQEEEKD